MTAVTLRTDLTNLDPMRPIPCKCGRQPVVGYLGHPIRTREMVAIFIRCDCGITFQEAVDVVDLADGGSAAVAKKAADAMRHWAAVVIYNLNPNTPAKMDREIEEIERAKIALDAANQGGLKMLGGDKKPVPVVNAAHISSMPDDIVAQVRRALSGIERDTTSVFTLKAANGTSRMYIIGRDGDGKTYSLPMQREEGLDSGIIFGS